MSDEAKRYIQSYGFSRESAEILVRLDAVVGVLHRIEGLLMDADPVPDPELSVSTCRQCGHDANQHVNRSAVQWAGCPVVARCTHGDCDCQWFR